MMILSGILRLVAVTAGWVMTISCISTSAVADTSRWGEETWSHSLYAGLMSTNKADELVSSFNYADNDLIGYALAYDRPLLNTPWSLGVELQLTYHFGQQTYSEIGVPITVRYRPEDPWFSWVEGFAFGLGMSHTTELPQIEVDMNGGSRQDLIYWMLEAEFRTGSPSTSWFMRIHHRSDAFGALQPEAGSNAVVLGLRQDF
jgi:hypothetical protein